MEKITQPELLHIVLPIYIYTSFLPTVEVIRRHGYTAVCISQ